MTLAQPAKAVDISKALTLLSPLEMDQYFVAFGPAGRQFCGTPNGYSAAQLPSTIVDDLLSGRIKKITWATFGSEPQSYFFAYEMKDGTFNHRIGKAFPKRLRPFIVSNSDSHSKASMLRVQLGTNRSYVAWAGPLWTCRSVPPSLQLALYEASIMYRKEEDAPEGMINHGSLAQVAWHNNGTYFVKIEDMSTSEQFYRWNFESNAMRQGWSCLWGNKELTGQELPSLVHVAIDPHSPTGQTFAYLKKGLGRDSDFVLQFEPEEMISRLSPVETPQQLPSVETLPPRPPQACVPANHSEGIQTFQWAFSKRAGRPHASDSWELDLKKGERLKVLQDIGNNWYIVKGRQGLKGYAHGSWLDFREFRKHADPQEAFARYADDTEKALRLGELRSFFDLSSYMDACAKEACKPIKQEPDGLRICVHDLHELLRGSGKYSLEFLKAQRNRFHPDKFARYCHPDSREGVKAKAEALFVLFGMLMDWLENASQRKGD